MFQIHCFVPGADKNKLIVDIICRKDVCIRGEAKYHSHCGSWKNVPHHCQCTLVVPMQFRSGFPIPPNCILEKAVATFEAEVLVVSIPKK
ncbi:hypothetical protein AX774_g3171 [Zancudomyces culisetae]|uniref:SHSP domain-containing protein n=1 Tax=Zancudomyces culisetae TaxID=1213189 RepID=A0A1R1PQV2_ZANCU|nr:hypothetical protein AX774_g3171 [Zancudomyces culisetae]|eukprot:OMH83329.1 hypothetical protein AX774_g3171 [Zancudomyces culisetae]